MFSPERQRHAALVLEYVLHIGLLSSTQESEKKGN